MTVTIENGVLVVRCPLLAIPEASATGQSAIIARADSGKMSIQGFSFDGKPEPVRVQVRAFVTPKEEKTSKKRAWVPRNTPATAAK